MTEERNFLDILDRRSDVDGCGNDQSAVDIVQCTMDLSPSFTRVSEA